MATHSVLIDDTGCYIEWADKSIKCKGNLEFMEALKIILTNSQQEAFSSDTRRTFQVSDKKLAKLEEFIKK